MVVRENYRLAFGHIDCYYPTSYVEQMVHTPAELAKVENLFVQHAIRLAKWAFQKPLSRAWLKCDLARGKTIDVMRAEIAPR